jgi:hypothetical protein
MKKSIYLSVLFLCSMPYTHAESVDQASESTQSALDDDFFNALQEASEQQEPVSDAESALDALTEAHMKQDQKAAQAVSPLQKYAMAVAVKALLYYGACKAYLASWLHYFTACLFDE